MAPQNIFNFMNYLPQFRARYKILYGNLSFNPLNRNVILGNRMQFNPQATPAKEFRHL